MEVIKVSKQDFEKLKKELKQMSDDDLDKVAGGRSPCPNLRCIYQDNHCVCPDFDEDE